MAKRIAYIVDVENKRIIAKKFEFKWFPGFAVSQKQNSIKELHLSIKGEYPNSNVLEVSSKSETKIGVDLSAFNLNMINAKSNKVTSVESAFQGSKVFENGGPYTDLFNQPSIIAKKDNRLKTSGKLIQFKFYSFDFPLKPVNLFYDWLYLNTLKQNKSLMDEVINYDIFTDIEFNPEKSLNCQAKSVALFVLLKRMEIDNLIVKDRNTFSKIYDNVCDSNFDQISIF